MASERAPLTRANGIGRKVADRILAELKEKVAKFSFESSTGNAGAAHAASNNIPADAVSALVNLGYGRSEAFGAISAASRGISDDTDLQSLIRAGLKELDQ